jgi:hypothetical protein
MHHVISLFSHVPVLESPIQSQTLTDVFGGFFQPNLHAKTFTSIYIMDFKVHPDFIGRIIPVFLEVYACISAMDKDIASI